MTFVNKNTRVFYDRGDIKPERKRSEARLKKYSSSLDVRAWCDVVEDRRQHILELVTREYAKCAGGIIPLEAIVNAALNRKNGDIQDIQKCLNKMWAFIEKVPLNATGKTRLNQFKKGMKEICLPKARARPLQKVTRMSRPEAECSEKELGKKTTRRYKVRSLGPAKITTKIIGLKEGFKLSGEPTEGSNLTQQKIIVRNAFPSNTTQQEKMSGTPVENSNLQFKEHTFKSNEDLGSQIIKLQDQLAAREALCNEQRLNIENLKNERDNLKKKIEDSLRELEELKNLNNVANPNVPTSCKDEISALEKEIREMRIGQPSPEEEALLIQREMDILKKYCMKQKTLEDENERLKSKEYSSDEGDLTDANNSSLRKIDEITEERNKLAEKVHQLETQLTQISNEYHEIDLYRNKAVMLDNALAERDELKNQLEKMKYMENENQQLRKKMEKPIEHLPTQKPKIIPDPNELEIRKTQSKCICLEKEIENLKKEREVMSKRIQLLKSEIEILRPKAKEAEMLKLERDKLQIKLNELSHVQVHNENLLLKCKCLESTLLERDSYKQKYEEIISMECQCDLLRNQAEENKHLMREKDTLKKQIEDLKTCINEQDEEIKKLISKIDDLICSKEETESRMKEALVNMRSEVEKKDSIIALSDERLASVQMQLKSSIQGVSCETICYKTRIEELERELNQSQRLIKALQKQIKEKTLITRQMGSVEAIARELAEAREENRKLQEIAKKMVLLTGDEHVQKMLKQSKCAVRKILEELGRQYREWDLMKKQQTVSKEHVYATCNDSAVSDDMEMKTELEEIKREKEKLEKIVSEIQNEKYARSCQKMMSFLKSENAKLKEQLRKRS